MQDRIESFWNFIREVEGPKEDSGDTATRWGITQKPIDELKLKIKVEDVDEKMAKKIFKTAYHDRIGLNNVRDDRIALTIADATFNTGPFGIKNTKRTLNEMAGRKIFEERKPKDNEKLAEKEINALNQLDNGKVKEFVSKYGKNQLDYYKSLAAAKPQKFARYLGGWTERVRLRNKKTEGMKAPAGVCLIPKETIGNHLKANEKKVNVSSPAEAKKKNTKADIASDIKKFFSPLTEALNFQKKKSQNNNIKNNVSSKNTKKSVSAGNMKKNVKAEVNKNVSKFK